MPQLRKDPVIGRWVIIADERDRRPSDFRPLPVEVKGTFCPFCPGNESVTPPEILSRRREGASPDQPGWKVRVVPNRFPALRVEGELERRAEGLYDLMNGIGAHEVIVESPRHDSTMTSLPPEDLADVLWAWRERIVDLGRDVRLRYAMIFKNRGAAAGASLEHEHSQLIALPIIPRIPSAELAGSADHFARHERCVYCDILRQDRDDGARVVLDEERFTALCPWASTRPFETWIFPRVHASRFEDTSDADLLALAKVLGSVLRRIDRALEGPAYNLMLHTSPLRDPASPSYHWHLEIVPTVARVAGFEWGTGFYINPTAPEEAAAFLRKAEG